MSQKVHSCAKVVIIEEGVETATYRSISEYVEEQLSGDEYGGGAIESLQRQSRNNSQAIGRLLDVLIHKGIIYKEELSFIVKGWVDERLFLGK